MESGKNQYSPKDNLPKGSIKKPVREQLGEIAGVSGKTIDRVETILTKGTKEDTQVLSISLSFTDCMIASLR